MKYYTIGEVFRLGLLKNFDGTPYKHKATISRIVSKMKLTEKKTAFGIAKTISEDQIKELNGRF